MAKHNSTPADVNHYLELADDEAYRIWRLSCLYEAGSPQKRIMAFFDNATQQRFSARRDIERSIEER